MKIVFFDFDDEVINALQKENEKYNNEKYDIIFENKSLLEIKEKYMTDINSVILVSPANSFGSMRGGIDYYINKYVFPNVEKLVQNEIGKMNYIYNENCLIRKKIFYSIRQLLLLQNLKIL